MTKLARYAWFVLVYNVAVIVFGAFVRATGSGAGCGRSWPTCLPASGASGDAERAIELTHRMSAGVALLLVAALAVLVWRGTSRGHLARRGAALSIVAIIGEALIGAMIVLFEWVADDASVARVVSVPLHLVNTLFLLGALALTIFWLGGGRRLELRRDRGVTTAVLFGGLALVLITASGAVTALADTLFPKGGDLSAAAHFLTELRIVHPVLAILAAVVGWWAASRAGARRSRAVSALFVIVVSMLLTGLMNVALGVPVWMQLVHLALADALWVSYVLVSAGALQARVPTEPRLSPSR